MDVKELINRSGGPTKVSTMCNVSSQAVSQWGKNNVIPPDQCANIERGTGGAERCEDMRPDFIWIRDEDTGEVIGRVVKVAPATVDAGA